MPKLFTGSLVPCSVIFCSAVNSHLVVVHNTDSRYLIGQYPCGEERQYCKYSRNPLQEGAVPCRGRALSVLTGNVSASLRPALNVSHKCKKRKEPNNFTRNTTSQLSPEIFICVYSGCWEDQTDLDLVTRFHVLWLDGWKKAIWIFALCDVKPNRDELVYQKQKVSLQVGETL